MLTIPRPAEDEYAPYYGTYIGEITEEDVLALLTQQMSDTATLLASIPQPKWTHRYAPGKWSVGQVVNHMADTERAFAYRALCFARNDATPLPGFDENAWAAGVNSDLRPLPALAEDLRATRQASLTLFRSLTTEAIGRVGTANGVRFSVRAIPWIIAGHERHHVRILRERYLS